MRYYSVNRYLQDTFGRKVYKLALSCVKTCPNRDGTLGTKGCIFCSAGGSGEFSTSADLPVHMQIEKAKASIKNKSKAERYIAYFQSYTNTYAEVSYLEKVFMGAAAHPQVVAVSIATRPDCLPPAVLQLLTRINRIKPVFLELGLQTIHEKTAAYLRRGYALPCYDRAVAKLNESGIHTVAHVILGLPGESREEMLETVFYVAKSGAQGIKLQLLHVLKGTDLALDYAKGMVPVLSLEAYTDLLCDCLEILPPEMVIHRLTGDGPKRLLIAPLWSGDKKQVLNAINRKLEEQNIIQGSKYSLYKKTFRLQ